MRRNPHLYSFVSALLMLAGLSPALYAATLSSNSVDGADLFSEDLIYHDQSRAAEETGYGPEWKVDLGYARMIDSLNARHPIHEEARSIAATLGETRDRTRFGASYQFSETPVVRLREEGPTFYLGGEWNRSGPGPLWDLKVRYGALRYRTDINGVLGLEQTELHGSATATWSLVSVYAGYGTYHYDEPAARFLAALSSSRAVRASISGLRYALYGFPDSSAELALTYTPSGPWTGTVEQVVSQVRAPRGTVYATQILVGRTLRKWNIQVGIEHDRDVQLTQNLGLLDLEYDFSG